MNRARLELLRALGLDLNLRVEPIEKMTYEPAVSLDPEEALRIALQSRADWKAQLKREETTRLNHSADRLERLPSISLFADYGTIGSSIHQTTPTRTYGFAVRIPIFCTVTGSISIT